MKRTLIIAEAGVNHNGSLDLAKQLVDAAAAAGVDYVKFQTFKAEKLTSKQARMAEYQKKNTGEDESQLAMLKKLELSETDHYELVRYCNKKGVKFFSTAFDLDSVEFLHQLGLGLWKIPSGELTNYPYLKKIAQYHELVILSTGMSEMSDVEAAMRVLLNNGVKKEQITVLHCNTEYPTPYEDVNLRAMQTMQDKLGVKVGYSDHTQGIEIPIAAVALGASIIEKHFTLDRTLPGPDQAASLEPNELKQMVDAIRHIEESLGSAEKIISTSERKNITIARKSIVAARNIRKGEILTDENLTTKRPGDGINPMEWERIVGTKAVRDFVEDEKIER